jgi:hypothetical protein
MNQIFLRSKAKIILWILVLLVLILTIFISAGIRSAQKTISYLPDNASIIIDPISGDSQPVEIKNRWCKLLVDHKGKISVKTPDEKMIISALTYYAEFEGQKNSWGLQNVAVTLINDSSVEIKGTGPNNVNVTFVLTNHSYLPKLDISVTSHYRTNTLIRREALVASFSEPVTQVYQKNRKIDKENFESEYWLQKEGVRFGTGERSAIVYHTPLVSSLQLIPEKKLLFINLDFSLDHPFVHIPYQQDEGKRWTNLSESSYATGSERNNSFSISIGPVPKAIPRLMLVPNGYKAGYVFTEHADGGNIMKNRAAYFGSEDITNADEARRGFVGHKIPVTKSVFYTGPETSPGASIYEGHKISSLLYFLDQLHSTGLYDLCLHTPENSTSNRLNLEKSMKFMKERYNTVSWIDHGFYGGKTNREASVCDGLDSTAAVYAADIWEKYDTKYFWSPSVEMIKNSNWVSVSDNFKKLRFYKAYVIFLQQYLSPKELKQLSIFQIAKELKKRRSYEFELNTLNHNLGNAFPTPLYWQHPTRTRQLYSWATSFEKFYGQTTVKNETQQLLNLISNQGVFFNHGYFVRNRDKSDGILTTVNGKLVIDPKFDTILAIMSQMRDKGDLYITTVKDLMDYWISQEKISFEYLPDGTIMIINNNDHPIKGLSLEIEAKKLLIDGKEPSMKRSGDDTIFWFDIEPHQTLRLQID